MPSAVSQILRSKAFLGWCVLLLCLELLGIGLIHGAVRTFDYRSFYAAGYVARTGLSHLYDLDLQRTVQNTFISVGPVRPFCHPPFEALLFLPFTFLPYGLSYLASIAANCILLGLAYFTGPGHSALPLGKYTRALAFFTFVPILLTIVDGQDSIVFLLLCCLALRQLENGNEWGVGALLGLGIFRPQLAIPIALLLAVRYGRRIIVSFIAVSASIAGLSVLLVRKAGITALISLISMTSLAGDHSAAAQDAVAVYPQRIPNLYGLIYICGGRHLSAHTSFLLTMLASAVVFACCAWVVRKSESVAVSFGIAIIGATLVSYHSASYDVAILVLPILLLSAGIQRYLAIACYVVPYLLLFCGMADWFALLTPIPLVMLIMAAVHVLRLRTSIALEHTQLAAVQ